MPKKTFPWPSGPLTAPYYRNRHLFTGDTTPPTRPAGPASASTRVPYLETGAGGTSGLYDPESRAVGLNEPANSSKINRALYSIQGSVDALAELDVAQLTETSDHAAQDGAHLLELDLSNAAKWPSTPTLVYLGPGTTTAVGGGDARYYCSNYVKPWATGGLQPLLSGVTGTAYSVANILSKGLGAGISLYAALPADLQAYPWGTVGTILAVVLGAPGVSYITFTGAGAGTAPSGTPAPGGVVCFFNYSLYQRMVASHGNLLNCFAISTLIQGIAPTQYGLNRNVTATGVNWLAGDIVYTSHYAYCPTLFFNEGIPAAGLGITLLHGTCMPSVLASESYALEFLRFAGTPQVFEVPLEIDEPLGGGMTQRCFDYANALIRAKDGSLKGSVGFDFCGHQLGGGANLPAFAGFIDRVPLEFNSPNDTVLAAQEPVSWAVDIVTLTAVPPVAQFYGAAATNTQLMLNVDMVELRTATNIPVGLFLLIAMGVVAGHQTCTILNLDGTAPNLAPAAGRMTIYRPKMRTGMWDEAGNLPGFRGGNVLIGDKYINREYPALRLIGFADPTAWPGAEPTPILRAYQSAGERTPALAAIDGTPYECFRLRYDGSLYFSGKHVAGADDFGSLSSSLITGAALWGAGGSDSRTVALAGVAEGAAEPWESRSAMFHFVDGTGATATADTWMHLSTTGVVLDSLAGSSVAGVIMGAPGDAFNLTIGNTFTAGNRDAGYLFSWLNAAGDMTVGLGLTTGGVGGHIPGVRREALLQENPGTHPPSNPPYGFGANASRFALHSYVSFGWQSAIPFSHMIAPCKGEPRTADVANWNLEVGVGSSYQGVWRVTGVLPAQHLYFPLNLPDGATISTVEVVFNTAGGAGTSSATVALSKCDWTAMGIEVGNDVGGGLNNLPLGYTTIPTNAVNAAAVDNTRYFYQILIIVTPLAGHLVRVVGVRVTYTALDLIPA